MAVFLVGAALDIFQGLISDLDTEGRYLFLNAIANQLRYPNTHTHYFSFILLYLFAESNQVRRNNFLLCTNTFILCSLLCTFLLIRCENILWVLGVGGGGVCVCVVVVRAP